LVRRLLAHFFGKPRAFDEKLSREAQADGVLVLLCNDRAERSARRCSVAPRADGAASCLSAIGVG
jgi:hypothetical protein